MSEKTIESKLRVEVQKRGGLALKWTSPFYTGLPDRMILMPGGKVYFREIKREGKTVKPKSNQELRINELKRLGFDAGVINDKASLDEFLNHISK